MEKEISIGMTPEELQPIIDKFNEEELKQQAIFGVFQYGGGSDESYIRANKEGLELFALQLLKSSLKTEEALADKDEPTIPLNFEEDWVDEDSDTLLQYIEPLAEKQKAKPVEEQRDKVTPKLFEAGCFIVIAIIVICVLVGFGTIIDWIF